MMHEDTSFAELADRLAVLKRRQKELGLAALAHICRSDEGLAGRLRDAFGLDDEKAAEWLAQTGLAANASPIELLAWGRRDEVYNLLVSIAHGFGA